MVSSSKDGLSLWRLISIKPKREILLTCTLALSASRASFILFSTRRWFLNSTMSIKSITTRPPISLIRSCLAISSAASRLVFKAVSSISDPRVDLAEFMSIDTNASVGSITMLPPDGSLTECS